MIWRKFFQKTSLNLRRPSSLLVLTFEFRGQMPLAPDLGILKRVGPRAQLARTAFSDRFQI
jgi:hypothetical protein